MCTSSSTTSRELLSQFSTCSGWRLKDLNKNYQTFIDEFTPVLYDLQKKQCEVVIAGDYNIDLLKVEQKTIFNQYLDTPISLSFFSKKTLPILDSQINVGI